LFVRIKGFMTYRISRIDLYVKLFIAVTIELFAAPVSLMSNSSTNRNLCPGHFSIPPRWAGRRGPGLGFGRLFLARTIIARDPIEESMERRPNNLTLYDAAS
jgi:hypothetical protein